ncbi:hypothetical protein M513_12705 [Trichuris suis]|uniref:Uncharacterized protein n=1 Tax=Trichuris suis TaxID=68888 RepID=A0A085LN56_9BILA|nr:hypothetical protein M513_12705 [Trichuris suis]
MITAVEDAWFANACRPPESISSCSRHLANRPSTIGVTVFNKKMEPSPGYGPSLLGRAPVITVPKEFSERLSVLAHDRSE